MRRILLFLTLIGICAFNTMADENNLAGGVLITHYVPVPPNRYAPDTCTRFITDPSIGIDDASEQVCRMDYVSSYWDLATLFVVATFHEDKIWCGTQFGLGDYNPYVFCMSGYSDHCLDNSLIIPTPGWPGSTPESALPLPT